MNTTLQRAPVFFISHGAPTFALEPGPLGAHLKALGKQLPGVKAVLVVSPHWQTRALQVLTTPKPETVHDFGGFPAALYQLQYPAPGQPELALEALRLLTQAGWPVTVDAHRGLDHGAWVPAMLAWPEADIPIFQLSVQPALSPAHHIALGRKLGSLRIKQDFSASLHQLEIASEDPKALTLTSLRDTLTAALTGDLKTTLAEVEAAIAAKSKPSLP